jgi:uncharacterized BrkB/YihY/UPF0761 family membrane protein
VLWRAEHHQYHLGQLQQQDLMLLLLLLLLLTLWAMAVSSIHVVQVAAAGAIKLRPPAAGDPS